MLIGRNCFTRHSFLFLFIHSWLIYKIWVWVPQSLIHFFCNLTQDLNGWSVVKKRTYVLSLSNSHSLSHAHKYREWQINIPQSRDQRYYRNCQPIDLLFTGTHHLHHPISCKLPKVCAMLLCVSLHILYIHSYLRKKVRLSFFSFLGERWFQIAKPFLFSVIAIRPFTSSAPGTISDALLFTSDTATKPPHHLPPPHLSTIRKGYVSQMKKMDRKTTSFPLKLRRPLFCMRLFFLKYLKESDGKNFINPYFFVSTYPIHWIFGMCSGSDDGGEALEKKCTKASFISHS